MVCIMGFIMAVFMTCGLGLVPARFSMNGPGPALPELSSLMARLDFRRGPRRPITVAWKPAGFSSLKARSKSS